MTRDKRSVVAIVVWACAVAAAATACNVAFGPMKPGDPAARVLFIGNSFTSYNGGLDQALRGLAPSFETGRIDAGGYTLAQHWSSGKAIATIRQGGYAYVVLQEQSQAPILSRNAFDESVRLFDAEIRRSGAATVLLMTWERPDSVRAGVTTDNLAKVYQAIGTELGTRVAPAGLAFARSRGERPNLELYAPDGHPTPAGTYLAACVVHDTLWTTTLDGSSYTAGLSAELRAYLQRIAAETVER